MTQEAAEQALKQAGFKAFVTTSADTEEPKGTVIEQNPSGGQEEPEGTSVTIVVSSFVEPTETPTVTPTGTPTITPTETPTPSGEVTPTP
jgi:serine/threonine-protein kinase